MKVFFVYTISLVFLAFDKYVYYFILQGTNLFIGDIWSPLKMHMIHVLMKGAPSAPKRGACLHVKK